MRTKILIFDLPLKPNAVSVARAWTVIFRKQIANYIVDVAEIFIKFFFELPYFFGQIFLMNGILPAHRKSTHDGYVNLYGDFTFQDAREHGNPLFCEGKRPGRAEFIGITEVITICDNL